jgi:hypothetical protein
MDGYGDLDQGDRHIERIMEDLLEWQGALMLLLRDLLDELRIRSAPEAGVSDTGEPSIGSAAPKRIYRRVDASGGPMSMRGRRRH